MRGQPSKRSRLSRDNPYCIRLSEQFLHPQQRHPSTVQCLFQTAFCDHQNKGCAVPNHLHLGYGAPYRKRKTAIQVPSALPQGRRAG